MKYKHLEPLVFTHKIKPTPIEKPKNNYMIAIVDTKKINPIKIKAETTPKNPFVSLSMCLRPIYDKEYGCVASPQKATCLSEKIGDAITCILTGKINDSYALLQTDRTHLDCEKDDGYKFEEVQKLRGCSSSGGFVQNNICTTEPGFCDCFGTGVDLQGDPTYKPYKIWNEAQFKCICDQESSKSILSEDGKCCSDKQCSVDDQNSHYDCLAESCTCNAGFKEIDAEGSPDDGKCIRACTSEAQNGLFNLITNGGYGCLPNLEVLQIYGNYRLGSLIDLCCNQGSSQCVLDTSVAKTNAINSDDHVWMVEKDSITCPRAGFSKKLVCDLDLGLNNYGCRIEGETIPGFDGNFCKEGSCAKACEDFCGVGNCQESHCVSTEDVPNQNSKLKYGNCSFTCV